jgi:hypothetical protein
VAQVPVIGVGDGQTLLGEADGAIGVAAPVGQLGVQPCQHPRDVAQPAGCPTGRRLGRLGGIAHVGTPWEIAGSWTRPT